MAKLGQDTPRLGGNGQFCDFVVYPPRTAELVLYLRMLGASRMLSYNKQPRNSCRRATVSPPTEGSLLVVGICCRNLVDTLGNCGGHIVHVGLDGVERVTLLGHEAV